MTYKILFGANNSIVFQNEDGYSVIEDPQIVLDTLIAGKMCVCRHYNTIKTLDGNEYKYIAEIIYTVE